MTIFIAPNQALRARPIEFARTLVSNFTDRRYGIETERSIGLEAFGLADPDRLLYVPSSWKTLGVLSRVLKPSADDVLVDFGAGKGRMVVMAALRWRLRRVVGVEIAPELTDVARTNVDAVRSRLRTRDVELVTADVATFDIPADMTIAYVYSSFTGPVFQAFLDAIERRLSTFAGRRLVIALLRPDNGSARDLVLAQNDEALRSRSWLKLMERVPMRSITGWRSTLSFYSALIG